MSYSMWSIDCTAVKLDENYLKALKYDIDNNIIEKLQGSKKEQLKDILDWVDDDMLEDISEFCCDNCDIQYYDYDENYAQAHKIDLETGKNVGDSDYFEGYVYPISYGSRSLYEPEYKSKDEFIEAIERELYIPTTFKLEDNVIFVTGVQGG